MYILPVNQNKCMDNDNRNIHNHFHMECMQKTIMLNNKMWFLQYIYILMHLVSIISIKILLFCLV